MNRPLLRARLPAGLLALLWTSACGFWPQRPPAWVPLRGRVLDLQGHPLRDVRLRVGTRSSRSGADGTFSVLLPPEPAWLEAHARGYLPALRPVLPGAPLVLRLSPDDGATLVIRAGGDVMAGRRFYSPDPGWALPAWLRPGDQAAAHRMLLEPVRPLLSHADLTLLNLETPLLADPVAERRRHRTAGVHPTKDHVFASAPALAVALRQLGVDVVGLANNHLYDALEPGLTSTLLALRRAGFEPGAGWFGAGETPGQAWRPAQVRVRDVTLSVLGCTTIAGAQHPLSYVASTPQAKGGAALCEPRRLVEAVQAARRRGPVIVMVHGGNEYQAEPTSPVAQSVELARRSGATLVLNHHPQMLGGLRWDGRSLVADSLGNLLFDQTLWSRLPSLLLEVHLRRGQVVRVMGYPLILQAFRPHPLVGDLADWVLQGVAGRQPGPWLLESGVLEADLRGRAISRSRWSVLGGPAAALWQIPAGARWCGSQALGQPQLGRDLLGVGGFEDRLVGAAPGAGSLWLPQHDDRQLRSDAAHRGHYGVRLQRRRFDRRPVLLMPLHRLPVEPGQQLSAVGWLRASANAVPRLQISWYGARRGASQARQSQWLRPRQPDRWQAFRLDLQVPAHTQAVGFAIALDPPREGRARLDLDDLALVRWLPAAAGIRQGPGWFRAKGRGRVCLSAQRLPGAAPDAPGLLLQAWPQPAPRPEAKRMSRLRR